MPRYGLTGRTVAITGSTGGLGRALAAKLSRRGARLALMDLDGAAAATQAAELGGDPVARAYTIDVRDHHSVQHAIDAAATDFGQIDVVIAGAGIGKPRPAELMDPAEFETTIDINLNGVYRTFKAALPHVAKTQGQLVAISSMARSSTPRSTPITPPARPASGPCATACASRSATSASPSQASTRPSSTPR